MTLSSTISGANLTKIRSDKYRARQCLVAVPDVIIVQFNPSVAPADSVYAEITVGAINSGSMSDVKSIMTVIYSITADYFATETYRTYVRKVSGTATLFIGQTGQNLTTSLFVTVLNQYEEFEKPRVERNGTQFANWDILPRRVLPVETALPTAEVLIDGSTAYTPTAVPKAMDNDATSTFTHAWESSNSNDTLDSGGTTASPSWTLEADAHRWIRYTYTDSNGNSNLRVITIWTVPKNLSSVVRLGFIGQDNNVANIQSQQNIGWTCNVPAISGITDIVKGTLCAVFSIEDYNATRGSIESNIDFVGYLGNETTVTGGHAQFGRISETRFELLGFGAKLSTTPLPMIGINSTSSPSLWDDIENPTPIRVLVYLLSEHSTFLHLSALSFPSNHTDFFAPSRIFTSEFDVAFDAIQYQADAMTGIVQYSRDGRIDISQNLVETDDTARNAADTVVTMTPSDWLSYTIDIIPNPLIKFLEVFAGVFNTTSGAYTVYNAAVPPVADIRGINEEQRVNMIITTDLSDANARLEVAQRSANLYAALNPTDTIRMVLKDEWRFLQPDVGAWYTFTVAITDTVRGISYDGNTRWQLLDISYSSNNETGRKEVNATFRRETSSTGANIEVTKLENNPNNEINALPGILPPYSGGNLGFTDGTWFDTFDTQPSSDDHPPDADCESLGFRPKDGVGATTTKSALLGESISYQVSGFGIIQMALNEDDDLISDAGLWFPATVGDPFGSGTVTSGVTGVYSSGWGHGDISSSQSTGFTRVAQIKLDLGSVKKLTSVTATFNLVKGAYNASLGCHHLSTSEDNITWDLHGTSVTFGNAVNGTGQTMTISSSSGINTRYLRVFIRADINALLGSLVGSALVTRVQYTTIDQFGDSLYQWHGEEIPSAYDTGDGLLFDGTQPASIPSYNEGHTYVLFEPSVNSGPLIFDFETPYSLSDMDNWSLQIIACFLGVS